MMEGRSPAEEAAAQLSSLSLEAIPTAPGPSQPAAIAEATAAATATATAAAAAIDGSSRPSPAEPAPAPAPGPGAGTAIAGLEPAMQALRELVGWPRLYAREGAELGVRWPKGLLLHGPPGCGKTLMVTTVAGAGVFKVWGS
jgi:hypothetical protein